MTAAEAMVNRILPYRQPKVRPQPYHLSNQIYLGQYVADEDVSSYHPLPMYVGMLAV